MFEALKKLFYSDDKRLRNSVITTQTITVAVKSPAYHEIIPDQSGYIVRVYDRKTSALLSETTQSTLDLAKRAALDLVTQYNEGGN